ncbi:MAG: DUF4313 domain-containing protein [Bacilli bacterium]|nr:DUF4313 domain-containing protein [Bacilli bacterium]
MKRPIAKINNKEIYLDIGNYENDKSLYLGLVDVEGKLYDEITINFKDMPNIAMNYIYINNKISDGLVDYLKDKKIISDTLMYKRHTSGSYELVKVDLDELRYYDNDSVDRFENIYDKKYFSTEVEEK